ncbi:MAG: hypothetical protein HQL60_07655 [Magnetococcales bacterium]|nr:hypothetical protein [Magnetococcales bacterium]
MLKNSAGIPVAKTTKWMVGFVLLAFVATAGAANDPNFISEEQFKEACQRFAQEDGIQPVEMNEYLSQCLMDLKMANSPGFDDESVDIVEPPITDTTAKKGIAPAQPKSNSKK